MVKCPNCGFDSNDGKFCIKCGQILHNQNNMQNNLRNDNNVSQPNNLNQQGYLNQQANTHSFNNNIPQQQNTQLNNQQFNQNTNQQGYNQQYNNNQQNTNRPLNQKSKIVGLILNMLLVGLGYAYVGKWGEGIVLLVIYVIMFSLGLALIFPLFIALLLWIYSLIKSNEMIDKYNAGMPY